MVRHALGGDHEIIDLSSDTEDGRSTEDENEWFDAQVVPDFGDDLPKFDDLLGQFPQHERPGANDRGTIDLTAMPDIDVPPSDHAAINDGVPQPDAQARNSKDDRQIVTEADCLQMVLNVFPDISVDHALKVINEKTTDAARTIARCELVITELLDGEGYPKEVDETKNRKRKRDDQDSVSDYEREQRDPEIKGYEQDALDLLRDEFLSVPIRHLSNTLKKEKTLFKAFGVLEEQLQTYRQIATPFAKIAKPRVKNGAELILIERGSQVPKELHAAKKRKEITAVKRQQAAEADQAEEMNLQQAQATHQMGECACCFDDVPLNRMISCNGHTTHFYCMDCPRQQIETLMGQSRCRPACFAVTDCTGTFTRTQLQQVLSEKTFERLEHMQQMQDLDAAGLDFLSECPFCDFKMECPPLHVDKEFRCESNKCGKTSCRLCNMETHIPFSCEEAKKNGKLTYRHVIEEAMSAALIRHCNRCKQPFVKELGCNKMTCSHCRNVQCYVCSKNVTDYNHFGEAQRNKCPLHENIEDRHEQEVKKAADEAIAKLRAEKPDLSEADLMVKVSDRVKEAEEARKGRAAADADLFPFHMVGDRLQNRAAPLGQEPLVAAARNDGERRGANFQEPIPRAQPPRPALYVRPPHHIFRPPYLAENDLPNCAHRLHDYRLDGAAAQGDEAAAVPQPAPRPRPRLRLPSPPPPAPNPNPNRYPYHLLQPTHPGAFGGLHCAGKAACHAHPNPPAQPQRWPANPRAPLQNRRLDGDLNNEPLEGGNGQREQAGGAMNARIVVMGARDYPHRVWPRAQGARRVVGDLPGGGGRGGEEQMGEGEMGMDMEMEMELELEPEWEGLERWY